MMRDTITMGIIALFFMIGIAWMLLGSSQEGGADIFKFTGLITGK